MTSLLVMTRLPREGRNKTRLIPALGAAGAMEFHDRLARHAIGRASSRSIMAGWNLTVVIEGGIPIEARAWLGDGSLDCREQSSGDLGERMRSAAAVAFSEGAGRVIIIGTDCPALNESVLAAADKLLDDNALVFGPALDGGYFLIGMKKVIPAVFSRIPWGGSAVLAASLDAAREAGIHAALLDALPDADVPEDLPAAAESLAKGATVSVIIPTFNEGSCIGGLVKRLLESSPHEIIVADGGSADGTPEIAAEAGARVLSAQRGRALQMNLAAAAANGEFLLFLHADTVPPENFPGIIAMTLNRPGTSAGAFRFQLGGDFGASPLIEALVHLRGTPYGDQGIFIRRSLFRHIGGFPDVPVMEDLRLVRKLRALGKIRIAPEPAITSPRRWESGGLIRTFLRHQVMLAAHHLGVSPKRIARFRI